MIRDPAIIKRAPFEQYVDESGELSEYIDDALVLPRNIAQACCDQWNDLLEGYEEYIVCPVIIEHSKRKIRVI